MKRRIIVTFLFGAALVLASCAAGSSESNTGESADETTTSVSPPQDVTVPKPSEPEELPVNAASPIPPLSVARTYGNDDYPRELQGLVAIAVNDLALRLDVATSAISVESVEEVMWSNGGLGCPQPGMMYTQVITDGLRIVLDYDGSEYAYHSGGTVEPFLCSPPLAGDSKGSVTDGDEPAAEDISTTEGTLQLEKVIPVEESVPTQQPGGPGGQPDE